MRPTLTPRVAVTGAGGFVGHHVVEHILSNTDWHIVCLDSFRHRGITPRIRELVTANPRWRERLTVITHDLNAPVDPITAQQIGDLDVVFHLASESHVDRSISDPAPFITNNVNVAVNVLDWLRGLADPPILIAVSTDEVYGPAPVGYAHHEWDPIIPSNPYAASKAAQEAVTVSYWRAYGLPVVMTNTMNIIGERQDTEKFVPMLIKRTLTGEQIEIHGQDGVAGSRFYLHARNQADALLSLATMALNAPDVLMNVCRETGPNPGGSLRYTGRDDDRPLRFHVVGEREVSNTEMADLVIGSVRRRVRVGYPPVEVVNFHQSRPGHDLRYALNGDRMTAIGWAPPVPLADSLDRTVAWTLAHREWLMT